MDEKKAKAEKAGTEPSTEGGSLALLTPEMRRTLIEEAALVLRSDLDRQLADFRRGVAREVEARHTEAAQAVHRAQHSAAAKLNDGIALLNDLPIPPDLTCLPPLPEPVRAYFARLSAWVEFRRREYGAAMEAPPDEGAAEEPPLPRPTKADDGRWVPAEGGPTISRWGR